MPISLYTFVWSLLVGLLTAGITYSFKQLNLPIRCLVSGVSTTIGCIFWNSLIEVAKVSQYLNVDIPFPLFPISFADASDAVLVFALTAFILGVSIDKQEPAFKVIKVAGIAATVTLLADVYCF